ncbi:hypothetical protein GGE43_004971 [Agrobacterium tumefaciens]|uniref:Uncharacterized protein n=1 Tax=Agrobacterium radiobacter TaxID=362 RepID=A0ABR6JFI5_AGRRD|nr:hypothetical protein [Agrobacterium radiobacter]MBB4321199.1 hypothetical protein [Agrobacterium radiobacter]MBB4338239.1 hypothetical protein [Agrobacterium radiobacter]MBB4493127.1 hypothetical protein [Agrobacterium radiobacter]MBB4498400.1 hypothetical protein [Agrobacterium radiobacter]MBB4503901.1 hypothetical protein [Agrobacterium radiobacter]
MSDSPILSVRNAARLYRSGETVVLALDGVSFDIHPGEVVGIRAWRVSPSAALLFIMCSEWCPLSWDQGQKSTPSTCCQSLDANTRVYPVCSSLAASRKRFKNRVLLNVAQPQMLIARNTAARIKASIPFKACTLNYLVGRYDVAKTIRHA